MLNTKNNFLRYNPIVASIEYMLCFALCSPGGARVAGEGAGPAADERASSSRAAAATGATATHAATSAGAAATTATPTGMTPQVVC